MNIGGRSEDDEQQRDEDVVIAARMVQNEGSNPGHLRRDDEGEI
jgi:hypothetical protein